MIGHENVFKEKYSFALAMWATTPARPENHLKQPPNNGKKWKKEQEQEQELSGDMLRLKVKTLF